MAANRVYFYFASVKPNHGPIGEQRRESSKKCVDEIRTQRSAVDQGQGDLLPLYF